MTKISKAALAFGIVGFCSAVKSGKAQAAELTFCWAAWDPANALVELSKDFEAQIRHSDEI